MDATAPRRKGFLGDLPARAEHTAVFAGDFQDSQEKMYVFGGKTLLGEANDFYVFDTKMLTWNVIDNAGSSVPGRRAGHSMVAATVPIGVFSSSQMQSNELFLFGGRGYTRSVGGLRKFFGYSDLWRYSLESNMWTICTQGGDNGPVGRQVTTFLIASFHQCPSVLESSI